MMSRHDLHDDLNAFRAAWAARVGEATAELIAADIEALRATGLVARAAKAGDALPTPPTLLDAHRRPFDLKRLVAERPIILVFYRGGWCPYCNLELRAYQAALAEIQAAGAELVAVSLETPDHSLSTAEKNDLAFTVLSDAGGALAKALGISFTLSNQARPYYEKAGLILPEKNGDDSWSLPTPSVFVVARGGAIAAAFIEPDYRKRTAPTEALAALKAVAPTLGPTHW